MSDAAFRVLLTQNTIINNPLGSLVGPWVSVRRASAGQPRGARGIRPGLIGRFFIRRCYMLAPTLDTPSRYTRDRRPALPTATELGVGAGPARADCSGLPDHLITWSFFQKSRLTLAFLGRGSWKRFRSARQRPQIRASTPVGLLYLPSLARGCIGASKERSPAHVVSKTANFTADKARVIDVADRFRLCRCYLDGVSTKNEPKRTTWQFIIDVFPNPPQNAHLGVKPRVMSLRGILSSCAGRSRSTMIPGILGVIADP